MPYTYFPSNGLGTTGFTNADDGGTGLNIGFIMKASTAGHEIRGVRWFTTTGTSGATAYLFSNEGTVLQSSGTWTSLGSNWYEATFPAAQLMVVNSGYIPAVVKTGARTYSYKASVFPHTGSPFFIESNQGRWSYSATPFLDDATSNGSQSWYGIDAVIWTPDAGETKTTTASLPVTFTLSATATSQVNAAVTTATLPVSFSLDASATSSVRPPLRVGNQPVQRVMVGSVPAKAIYVGSTLVWSADAAPQAGVTTGSLPVSFGMTATASSTLDGGGGGTVPGWLRTTSNTGLAGAGVTEGMLTNYTDTTASGGILTINTNQTRKRISLGGNQLRLAAGVTLTECLIEGTRQNGQGLIRPLNPNVSLIDCTIRNTINPTGDNETQGINTDALNGLTISGCLFENFTITLWLDGPSSGVAPSLVTDSYIISNVWQSGSNAHRDGFTRRSGHAPLTIQRTRIQTEGNSVTGAFFTQDTWGAAGGRVGGITSIDSYFEGAGRPITIEESINLVFTNNRLRWTEYSPGWSVADSESITWNGNFFYANDPANDYKGAAFP